MKFDTELLQRPVINIDTVTEQELREIAKRLATPKTTEEDIEQFVQYHLNAKKEMDEWMKNFKIMQ